MFAERQDQELAAVKELTREFGISTQLVLKRVREARGLLAPHGPLLAFVHIPKTAGGTATNMFVRAYSKAAMCKAGNFIRGPDATVGKVTRRPGGWEAWHRKGGRVAVGHVPYGVFRRHLPEDTRYMTFLREPVDRVLSHYYRHVHHPELRTRERAERQEQGRPTAASLEEALVAQDSARLSNLSTRFLCGHPSPMRELPASALDDSKANLREFAFVGIQEWFEESIVLLQRTLGLELVPYMSRHVSAGGGRPTVDEISDAERELITMRNRLDIELYEFALELFDDAVTAADESLAADAESLRASSADLSEQAIESARVWLERELPLGRAKRWEALRVAAKAAGVPISALSNAVSRHPSVASERDSEGKKLLIRSSEPRNHGRAHASALAAARSRVR